MITDHFPFIPIFFWLLLFLFLWKIPSIGKRSGCSRPNCVWHTVSIIVPARNEEKSISSLLDSLSKQSIEPLEIIIVDDNSRDATARVASSSGAKLLSLLELPVGWTGKAYACWKGAQAASGDVLVFLDCDTRIEPDGLKKLVTAQLQEGGFLSVQPYHRMERNYERLSSFFNLILFLNMNISSPIQKLNSIRGAFGPCLVCNRADYFGLGGHEAVRGEIVEDIALARLALKKKYRVSAFTGKGVISFRMYPGGLGHLIEGWTKNFAAGAGKSSPLLFLLTVGWVAGALTGPLDIVKGVSSGDLHFIATGVALYSIFSAQNYYFLEKLGNFGFSTAIFYPIHLLFFVFVFLRSLIYTGPLGYVYWKGRKIPLR